MIRRLTVALLLLISLVVGPSAQAEEEGEEHHEPPKTEVSYAWQTILVDGAAVLMMANGIWVRDREVSQDIALAGLTTYAVGPAVVHLAHGSPAKAGISVGVRVIAPVAGAAVGFGAGYVFGKVLLRDELAGVLFGVLGLGLGGLAGYGGAVTVDAAVLAKEGR